MKIFDTLLLFRHRRCWCLIFVMTRRSSRQGESFDDGSTTEIVCGGVRIMRQRPLSSCRRPRTTTIRHQLYVVEVRWAARVVARLNNWRKIAFGCPFGFTKWRCSFGGNQMGNQMKRIAEHFTFGYDRLLVQSLHTWRSKKKNGLVWLIVSFGLTQHIAVTLTPCATRHVLGQGHTTTTAGANWRWRYPIFCDFF